MGAARNVDAKSDAATQNDNNNPSRQQRINATEDTDEPEPALQEVVINVGDQGDVDVPRSNVNSPSVIIYDQNRNLNLDSSKKIDTKADETTPTTSQNHDHPSSRPAKHQADSPILSLIGSDDSTGCVTGAGHSSNGSTNTHSCPTTTTCSTQQLSASRVSQELEDEDDDCRQCTRCSGHRGAKKSSIKLIGGPEAEAVQRAQEDEQELSMVRQLGRRMSVIPQLLARRLSRRGSNSNYHHTISGFEDYSDSKEGDFGRRFSSPSTTSARADTSAEETHVDAIDRLQVGRVALAPGSHCSKNEEHSKSGASDQPAPTTVAGVGGTITTVTRSKRKTAPLPRLVAKNGTVNLFIDNIDRRQYVRDLFTTMIDIKWRYNLMAAAFGFVFSWLFFACIWYIVLYVHDDLVHENDPAWSPCIVNVNSFPAALLFSIETQSTLGFGSRIISVECPGAIVIFCIQLIFGVVVECLIVGMVFAKLSRPAKRSQTIMFSKYATVCLREGRMCLMFRVGDVRSKSHIIGATIRASLVSQKITEEGETIPFYHHQLKVRIDDSKNQLLLIWPVTIVHLIDRTSPFYGLNSDELANFKFEIITVLEGTVESTGQSIQVRSSYLPSEVKWGYRFEPVVSTHGYGRHAQTIIDYNKFNRVYQVDTPTCSPAHYYELHRTGANRPVNRGRPLDHRNNGNGDEQRQLDELEPDSMEKDLIH